MNILCLGQATIVTFIDGCVHICKHIMDSLYEKKLHFVENIT